MGVDKAAFPIIKDRLGEYCGKLFQFPRSPYWIHESPVANYIGLPRGSGQFGQSEALTALIACIRDGYGGSKKQKNVVSTGVLIVNLKEQHNPSGICYQVWGQVELFDRGVLATEPMKRSPRWFHFGDDFGLDVRRQKKIVDDLVGNYDSKTMAMDDPAVIPMYQSRRRKSLFKSFFKDSEDSIPYKAYDVPAIASKFIETWDGVTMSSDKIRRRSFQPDDLSMIEDDFRRMLLACNLVGRIDSDNGKLLIDMSSRTKRIEVVRELSSSGRQSVSSNTDSSGTVSSHPVPVPSTPTASDNRPLVRHAKELPDCLKLQGLRCVHDGVIAWDMVSELASLELMFDLHRKEGIAWDALANVMGTKGVKAPSTFEPVDLPALSDRNKMNASRSIATARAEIMEAMGDMFQPKHEEFLHEWLADATAYSQGRRVEADNFDLHPTSRCPQFSLDARWILRCILFSFNLTMENLGGLWAAFYALIMRRVIPLERFIGPTAIWNNVMTLWSTDTRLESKRFLSTIQKKTKHGFTVYSYISADDSKHFGRNRHVLLMSHLNDVSPALPYLSVPFDPVFRLISTAPNEVKSNNFMKNADDIIETVGLWGAAYINGGVSDNAYDAVGEMRDTHSEIFTRVADSNDQDAKDMMLVNGVRRRPIVMGDPYHWANLAVMHASKGMAGDTVNAEHEQVHHRQLLMSMHSLNSANRPLSQFIMNRVMGGRTDVKLRTWRERQQRWLVNQRYAAYVLTLLAVANGNGVMCLIAWGLYFANYSRSDWKRRVGKEIAVWLSMPSILLGLHFEAELGNYFEQVYSWHNRKGPFHQRSGFRMMELFDCYFDFELAWWNAAVTSPEKCLPKTMKYWDENFDGEEKATRLKQIKRGLNLGREEVIKITKRYLMKPPVLLLVLTNRKRGAPFLRAVLSVFHEYCHKVPDGVTMVNDIGEGWGCYVYQNPDDRPEEERVWYDLLTRDDEQIDDLIHFWRQICLNWPIVTNDLQRLSLVTEYDDMTEGEGFSPLAAFAEAYPILFECLYAVFGAMMSNSRLCEQIHGMMRHGLKAGIGMDQADHHRQFSSNIDYGMRQERRDLATEKERHQEDRKKAPMHLKTKPQMQKLGQQLVEGSARFAKMVHEELEPDDVAGVKMIMLAGRRAQDKENLRKEVEYEDEKASRLTRTKLTMETVKELARATKPTNDALFTFDRTLISWREAIADMSKVSFWKEMNMNGNWKNNWVLARKSMIFIKHFSLKAWKGKIARYSPRKPGWWGYPPPSKESRKPLKFVRWQDMGRLHVYENATVFNWGSAGSSLYADGSIFATITSKSKSEAFISEYLAMAKKVSKILYSYVKAGDKGGFEDKSVIKDDVLFLFIRFVDGALDADKIVPAEEALVRACRGVDKHYKCALGDTDIEDSGDGESSDDSDDDEGILYEST